MSRILALLCIVLSLATPVSSDPPAITLTLNPLHGFEPLTVLAQIRVEPAYENRAICLLWDNRADAGSGCWEIEGQYARRLHTYTVKELPAGTYQVLARLIRVRDVKDTPIQTVRVLDSPF